MINVTKTYLPDIREYKKHLDGIWKRSWVTNRGPLVLKLEKHLKKQLNVNNLLFVSNGTIALQLAIKALKLKGEIITTPFSYVATTTSILWENCTPVFADIEPHTYCIDPTKIEQSITKRTTAILATHVYGYPCDVEAIERIAKKHKLKVIYDGAHAFGVRYKGKSLLSYGDVSTLSFHATKLIHTIEGGAVIVNNNSKLANAISLLHTFGHIGDDYYTSGINGKNSEFHAAMGLCTLPHFKKIVNSRKQISESYDKDLREYNLTRPKHQKDLEYNYSYYPVLLKDEYTVLAVKKSLAENNINTRRYFYPSLNKLPYIKRGQPLRVAENIAKRVLCLPLYPGLKMKEVQLISSIIKKTINR